MITILIFFLTGIHLEKANILHYPQPRLNFVLKGTSLLTVDFVTFNIFPLNILFSEYGLLLLYTFMMFKLALLLGGMIYMLELMLILLPYLA